MNTKLLDHIPPVVELSPYVVKEVVDPKTELVNQVRLEDTSIVDQTLMSRGRGEMAVQIERRVENVFVVPANPSEPVRPGALHKIDATGELIFVRDVVVQGQIVAHQRGTGLVRHRIEFQHLQGNRIQARCGYAIGRERLTG